MMHSTFPLNRALRQGEAAAVIPPPPPPPRKPNIALFVMLGFLAACVFDVACPRHADAAIVANAITAGWRVVWDHRVDQSFILAITECKRTPFYVFDQQPIVSENQSDALIRRQHTPHGERCTVSFQLLVDPSGDGHDVVVDSIVVIQED